MKVRAVVDRFEDGWAVLLLEEYDNKGVNWPRQALPPDCAEGDVLQLDIGVDAAATAAARERSAALLADLLKGPGGA